MKNAVKNKKKHAKVPFYAHLLTIQESQAVTAGTTLKFPSDIDETNRTSDW